MMFASAFETSASLLMMFLLDADIFYRAGAFEVSRAWIQMTRPGGQSHCLVEALQTRVQYNSTAFIGVCGGALISGASNLYGLMPLDLLQGTTIRYDACCSASSVDVMTTSQAFQMTSGCAIAINVWHETHESSCFPVVKNQSQWWSFAERNSTALAEALVQKLALPSLHISRSSDARFFRLDGIVYMDGCWNNCCKLTLAIYDYERLLRLL